MDKRRDMCPRVTYPPLSAPQQVSSYNTADSDQSVSQNWELSSWEARWCKPSHVVVHDWIKVYIEALLMVNPMLYLSEICERVEEDLQLQPHEAPSLSVMCSCAQRLNFTSEKR